MIQYLFEQDYTDKIIVVDNFITCDKNRFMKFKEQYADIIMFDADVCDKDLKTELVRMNIHNIDEIYHLASLSSPPVYKTYPIETLNVGYIGTKYMLHLAEIYPIK